MLIFLISLAWLAIVIIAAAACRVSSRADTPARTAATGMTSDRTASDEPAPVVSVPGLTIWDCPDPIRLRSLDATISGGRVADTLQPARARRLWNPVLRGSALRGARGRGRGVARP